MAKTAVINPLDDSQVPTFGRGQSNFHTNIDESDIVLPKVKLLQGTSAEIEDYPEAKPNNFWFTGMDHLIGQEFDFVVCALAKRFLLSAPMEDGQGILATARDGETWDRMGRWEVRVDKGVNAVWEIKDLSVAKSGLAEFGTYYPDDPERYPYPAATRMYDILAVLPDHLDWGPVRITLFRKALKRAREGLILKMRNFQARGVDVNAVRFRAQVFKDTNSEGQEFANWTFKAAGYLSNKEQDVFDLARNSTNLMDRVAITSDEAKEGQSEGGELIEGQADEKGI